jgi:hypothetical protein
MMYDRYAAPSPLSVSVTALLVITLLKFISSPQTPNIALNSILFSSQNMCYLPSFNQIQMQNFILCHIAYLCRNGTNYIPTKQLNTMQQCTMTTKTQQPNDQNNNHTIDHCDLTIQLEI